jgi:hypothetical protein
VQVFQFLAIGRRPVERDRVQILVRDRDVEPVAEGSQRVEIHLLLLVRDVLAFTGLAEAEAFHRLGEDNGRLPRVARRRIVRRVNLAVIVAATIQAPDLLVRHVGNHLGRFRVLAEEFFTHVGTVTGLVDLVLAVDGFFHETPQLARLVFGQQRVPARTPDDLDDVPARAPERRLEFLDDLAVAAHRPVQALQVAVDDEYEIVEAFPDRHRDGAHGFRLVHLAVAEERPHLAIGGLHQAPVLHVAHETRLVDGHHRAKAHGHGRKLPEFRHQPRMRIRRQPSTPDLAAE